jgi:hypothetical protein
MKTSELRPALLKYLGKITNIEEWSLDNPVEQLEFSETASWNLGANTVGFLPPLRSIDINNIGTRDITARATQELFIMVRQPRELKYHELPIAKLEGYWVTISTLVAANYNKLLDPVLQAARGIQSMSVVAQEYPVGVSPVGEQRSDWLITLSFGWYVSFLVDLEDGTLEEGYTITGVSGKVFRSHLMDFENKVLDFNSLYSPRSSQTP